MGDSRNVSFEIRAYVESFRQFSMHRLQGELPELHSATTEAHWLSQETLILPSIPRRLDSPQTLLPLLCYLHCCRRR